VDFTGSSKSSLGDFTAYQAALFGFSYPAPKTPSQASGSTRLGATLSGARNSMYGRSSGFCGGPSGFGDGPR
jgi:hypothetical protein